MILPCCLQRGLLFFYSVILFLDAGAQTTVRLIPPRLTGEGITEVHGSHIALYNMASPSRHKLVFMIEGTGASAISCRGIDSVFAGMGFHVLSPDYVNNVITTVCSPSTDNNCFDHFRQEIVFGSPVSPQVEVDSANSLVRRLSKLLVYLSKNDPSGGWDEFLSGGQPRWDKIIAAGHSQGAGHAAYLGKSFELAGVLLFSGPQDYLEYFHAPAAWQEKKGLTPVSRYYAFLNLKDPFHYSYQVADVSALTRQSITDTTMVFPDSPVLSGKHILVNDIPTKNPHGSTLEPVFAEVWKYMAGSL